MSGQFGQMPEVERAELDARIDAFDARASGTQAKDAQAIARLLDMACVDFRKFSVQAEIPANRLRTSTAV